MCTDVASLHSSRFHFLLAKQEKREPRAHGAKRSKKVRSGGRGREGKEMPAADRRQFTKHPQMILRQQSRQLAVT